MIIYCQENKKKPKLFLIGLIQTQVTLEQETIQLSHIPTVHFYSNWDGPKGETRKKKKGRERERSWSRNAPSQLQQRGLADLDPGWVGMILAKQLREMTAVRQGQTDRDSSLSPSLFSMFSLFFSPSCNGYWFFTTKTRGLLSSEVAELVKRFKNKKIKKKRLKVGVSRRNKSVDGTGVM